MIITVNLKLFKLIIIIIMSAKKKMKFITFKFFKDFIIITSVNFNKRRTFRALSNFNVSARLILHNFKLFNYVSVTIIN